VEYPVDDLLGDQSDAAARLMLLIEEFVAPETWRSAGGAGTITASGKQFTVVQTAAVQRELETFLDRLRKARGKATKNPATSLASRLADNREALEKPITVNFRPGVPLETLLARLEKDAGLTLTADYPALTSAGHQAGDQIGCASDKHPLEAVLSALCEPREWAWRVVAPHAVEVTTREGMRRRAYVEFYKIPPSRSSPAAAQELVERIRNQLADEGWRGLGGRGSIAVDEPSRMLIVRQHQDAQFRLERALAALIERETEGTTKTPSAAPQPTVPPARPTGTPPAAGAPTATGDARSATPTPPAAK
jgi:hypothetical protein